MLTGPQPRHSRRPLVSESPALPVRLNRGSTTPLAVQLAEELRTFAADGRLRSGDRLPSTRALATQLAVSRTVTAAAYEQLHAEGWIAGRHGSGTYVTTAPPGSPRARPRRARVAAPGAPSVDLRPGSPWIGGLDRSAWRRAWRGSADVTPLQRHERAGVPAYRAAVAEHLLRHRGLRVSGEYDEAGEGESVLATGGTTAAVAELAASVLHRGDLVAIEDPGYQRAVATFRAAGMRVVPVPVDADGLLLDAVPASAKVVYCSPAHQYPLGRRMSAGRRVELVERARRQGWLVVEDDYDGELRYDVAPLPLLAALAPDVVVHLGTTSKILTPTLGAGWMVAPPPVVTAVLEHRDNTGTTPAAAGQLVLVELARNGDLGRHLRKLRRELSERRALLVTALTADNVPVLGDDAGAHLVIPLPDTPTERAVIDAARTHHLVLDGLARHHQGKPTWSGIALGYAACSRTQLTEAIPTLVDLVTTT
ncbi:PLP-dependent aminotransferase family protein [Actinokineospora sp. PR83]|uniref:MocR-like pyridoxine biosynthesis transcription factor PdxR n=1 Tax=Actinokineospora sp. PR83 TaxID=2884908 RepID=UPI001F29CD56|nr:PLP-dependent aminotransferase family protein [Actinokineospora sp. PR83]MCG8919655.1 PLP-dependent aminotransferase family protein [Actinokineospora sp. PR83]